MRKYRNNTRTRSIRRTRNKSKRSRQIRKSKINKRRRSTLSRRYTQKNYRVSPTTSATLYSVGHVRRGNDGNRWKISKSRRTGIKRWVRYT